MVTSYIHTVNKFFGHPGARRVKSKNYPIPISWGIDEDNTLNNGTPLKVKLQEHQQN